MHARSAASSSALCCALLCLLCGLLLSLCPSSAASPSPSSPFTLLRRQLHSSGTGIHASRRLLQSSPSASPFAFLNASAAQQLGWFDGADSSDDSVLLARAWEVRESTDTVWVLPALPSSASSAAGSASIPRRIGFDLTVHRAMLLEGDLLQLFEGGPGLGGRMVKQWSGGPTPSAGGTEAEAALADGAEHIELTASSATMRLHSSSLAAADGVFSASWSATTSCPPSFQPSAAGECAPDREGAHSPYLFVLLVVPGLGIVALVALSMGPARWRHALEKCLCPRWRRERDQAKSNEENRRKEEKLKRVKSFRESRQLHGHGHGKHAHAHGKHDRHDDRESDLVKPGKTLDNDDDDVAVDVRDGNKKPSELKGSNGAAAIAAGAAVGAAAGASAVEMTERKQHKREGESNGAEAAAAAGTAAATSDRGEDGEKKPHRHHHHHHRHSHRSHRHRGDKKRSSTDAPAAGTVGANDSHPRESKHEKPHKTHAKRDQPHDEHGEHFSTSTLAGAQQAREDRTNDEHERFKHGGGDKHAHKHHHHHHERNGGEAHHRDPRPAAGSPVDGPDTATSQGSHNARDDDQGKGKEKNGSPQSQRDDRSDADKHCDGRVGPHSGHIASSAVTDRNGNGSTIDDFIKDEVLGLVRHKDATCTTHVIGKDECAKGSVGFCDALSASSSSEHVWTRRLKREVKRTVLVFVGELIGTSINLFLGISYINTPHEDVEVFADKLAAAYLAFSLLAFLGAVMNAWSRISVIQELVREMREAVRVPLSHHASNAHRVAPQVELAFLERQIHHLKIVGLTLFVESLPFACLGFTKLYRQNIVQNNLLQLVSCGVSAFWVGSKITRLLGIPEFREHVKKLEEDAEEQEHWEEERENQSGSDDDDSSSDSESGSDSGSDSDSCSESDDNGNDGAPVNAAKGSSAHPSRKDEPSRSSSKSDLDDGRGVFPRHSPNQVEPFSTGMIELLQQHGYSQQQQAAAAAVSASTQHNSPSKE